jgi:hypothetical protein
LSDLERAGAGLDLHQGLHGTSLVERQYPIVDEQRSAVWQTEARRRPCARERLANEDRLAVLDLSVPSHVAREVGQRRSAERGPSGPDWFQLMDV